MAKGIAARKDFDPADYRLVGYFYLGGNDEIAESYKDDMRALEAALGESMFEIIIHRAGGQCESCGTRYAHGAVIRHTSGTLLAIGQNCAAEYFGLVSIAALRAKEAKKAAERNERKAKVERFIDANSGLREAFEVDHHIIADIERKLRQYGSISERQVELVFKIAREIADRVPTVEPQLAPVQAGTGLTVEGVVLGTKYQFGAFGETLKMLVQVETSDGVYKLWGTVPSAIGVDKGDRVRFVANVDVSKDDRSFGFFNRPRKASVIEKGI